MPLVIADSSALWETVRLTQSLGLEGPFLIQICATSMAPSILILTLLHHKTPFVAHKSKYDERSKSLLCIYGWVDGVGK